MRDRTTLQSSTQFRCVYWSTIVALGVVRHLLGELAIAPPPLGQREEVCRVERSVRFGTPAALQLRTQSL